MTNITPVAPSTTTDVVTPDHLVNEIKVAEKGFITARKNTTRAAATIYYVWYHCVGGNAADGNKDWFAKALKQREEVVKAHNDGIKAKIKSLKEVHKRQLGELNTKLTQANSDASKQDYKQKIKAAENKHNDEVKALKADEWIDIGSLVDTEVRTTVARYVLNRHEQNSKSSVHRFATVLKWLINELSGEGPTAIDSLVKALDGAGGFDAVYEAQRTLDGKTGDGATGTNGEAPQGSPEKETARAAVSAHFSATLRQAQAVLNLNWNGPVKVGDYIAFIGRADPNGVAVLGGVNVPADAIFDLAVNFGESSLLPVDDATEFVATALGLGELVIEDSKAKTPVQRHLAMIVNDAPYLLLSSLEAKANIVVRAKPVAPRARGLFAAPGHWQVFNNNVKELATVVADPVVRKTVTTHDNKAEIDVGDDFVPSPFGWDTANKATGTKTESRWINLSAVGKLPLDVEGFKSDSIGIVQRAELTKLAAAGTIGDVDVLKATGKAKVCAVKLGKGTLEVGNDAVGGVITCTNAAANIVELKVLSAMMHNLVHKLLSLSAMQFEFKADKNGALAVSFATAQGCFEVYLPSCDADGKLETRRFVTLSV